MMRHILHFPFSIFNSHDFGHRVATRGEFAHVHVWDDANHNGVWDEDETGNKLDINPKGHTTCVTNELA